MRSSVQTIILAAGKSTRFNTGKTKLTEKICGQQLVLYPLNVLKELDLHTTVVVGFEQDAIRSLITKHHPHYALVEQTEQLGTGHAIQLTQKSWVKDHILIMKADIPLVSATLLQELYDKHCSTKAAITFIGAHNDNPTSFSYGRVVRQNDTLVIRKPHELDKKSLYEHCCINSGIMIAKRSFLETAIKQLTKDSHSGEYHMSQLINLATKEKQTVTMHMAPFDRVRGINNMQELWAAEQIKRAELVRHWMDKGVRFSTPQSIHIDLDVEIGVGSFIGCGVHILSGTTIGTNTTVHSCAMIENSTVGNNVMVYPHTIIRKSRIEDHAEIGPFAHIKENCIVGVQSQVGNFVELTRSTLGSKTKVKHLAYLGDTTVGNNANIGAGTITCNYNGATKEKTVIKDYVFIGTNNSLVAPVTINEKAYTAAGSVITSDVPAEALAIGRARQVNKEGYAKKMHKKNNLQFFGAVKTTNETSHEM